VVKSVQYRARYHVAGLGDLLRRLRRRDIPGSQDSRSTDWSTLKRLVPQALR
jgi:hypothetical protein